MIWPTSDDEWAAAPTEFIRQFVIDEGLAFDFDLLDEFGSMKAMYDQFSWSYDPKFEVAKLSPMMKDRREWLKWYANERKYNMDKEDPDPEYYDRLEQVVSEHPGALNPIVCVEFKTAQTCFNGQAHTVNVGDGWHRTAISILKGVPTIRAIVGKHKTL